jgi:Ala-tRNA(Pro) deacylase
VGEASVIERLTAALEGAGISYRRMQHEPVYTSAQAAAVRGTSLHSGAKALIVKHEDEFVMVITPADLALDNNALRKLLGTKRMRFANRDELLELTGLTPGSIPPFGSLFGLRTICDQRLADNETINFNAGSHSESIQLSYDAYVAFESPQIASISKPQEPASD